MTDRWINVVLAVVVTFGLVSVAVYERPRAAQERAELLDQDVVSVDEDASEPESGNGGSAGEPQLEIAAEPRSDETAAADGWDGAYGVTASHPVAVDVGMAVLEAGGTAVDAAVAVSYALSVVEPFGSGLGGGGAMLVHPIDEPPIAYDYRETAPQSGEIPASEIGVPGFAAGMEQVHAEHGTLDFDALIDPAIALAEDGIEVSTTLAERLEAAAYRMPIHQLPRLYPDGQPLEAGEALRQPEHAEALRMVRDGGAEVMQNGELGTAIAEEVSGLEVSDLEAYEVMEVPVAEGELAGYDVLGVGPPVSGPTLVGHLQIADAAGIADLTPETADHVHVFAQSYRSAYADRAEHIADPTIEDVPLEALLSAEHAAERASRIPDDSFVDVDDERSTPSPESDTTHIVTVDPSGTMVSATNTLSNFFGSGLAVSGFFLNDQLKNFARSADSVNHAAPGKRPRSFITPTIVAADGHPVLGIGSPGGRRIPTVVAQVILRWAVYDESLEDAVVAPRVHLEGRELQFEESPDSEVAGDLSGRGYEVVDDIFLSEYYGAVQALMVDPESGEVSGMADERRGGDWRAEGP